MNESARHDSPHHSRVPVWLGAAAILLLVVAGCTKIAARPTVDLPAPSAALTETSAAQLPTPLASPMPSPTPSQLATDVLAVADDLARKSQIEDAIALYASLAATDPQDARPEIGWAWALIYDDEPAQAVVHARRGADLDAANPDAWAVLARASAGAGDAPGAMDSALQAVSLAIGSGEARAVLAEAHLISGQNVQALRAIERALSLDPRSADVHRVRARINATVEKQPKRASGELQVAASIQPQLWLRRHELGLMLSAAGNYDAAALAFEDALALRPKAESYAGLGEARYQLEEYGLAQEALARAIALGLVDAVAYGVLAASSAHLGQCDEAGLLAQMALALDPGQPYAAEAVGLCPGAP